MRRKGRDPDKVLATHFKRHGYNLTVEEYRDMLIKQGNLCKICRSPPGKRSLHIDHCHTTGKVRGLLCCNCNVMIAQSKDDPLRLILGAEYLTTH